jgi:hypothetical protein
MKTIDLAGAQAPTQAWLRAFMYRVLVLEPRLRAVGTQDLAVTAHGVCWLLDLEETAELSLQAVRHH